MEIINMPIDQIKPYPHNARKHNKKQISALAESIRRYGFRNPILIDHDGIIVNGHGRHKAAMVAGLKEVPCIYASGMTEEQIKEYRLADNQLGDMSMWDLKALGTELGALDFDMAVFDFNFDKMTSLSPDYKQSKNLDNFFKAQPESNNEWGIPNTLPTAQDLSGIKWVSFGEKATIRNHENTGIHFYIDDYKFDVVWKSPDKWIKLFQSCRAVVTPDFSNYTDMPKAQQLWNHYRRQWLGAYWQGCGVNVVSSLSWANGQIFDWSFAGIPQHTVCATSFVGDTIDKSISINELRQVIALVKPSKLYVKANKKDQELLSQNSIQCEFIPPYQFKG